MPPESIIRSRHNPIYKQLRSLLRRDRRHQERAFLVEGPRFIADAQRFGAVPQLLVFSESFANELDLSPELARAARILDDELFESVADTVTSQGMIGVFPFPNPVPLPNVVPFLLIADGIQDPGNLGTLLRSAAGAGVTQVIILPGTVDPWNPKTIRAAAAAHFLVPIASMTVDTLPAVFPSGMMVVGADAAGAELYDQLDLSGPLAVVIGSEGSGLSPQIEPLIDRFVSIPLANGVESLNAGVAGSVVLFEASRQRRKTRDFGQKSSV